MEDEKKQEDLNEVDTAINLGDIVDLAHNEIIKDRTTKISDIVRKLIAKRNGLIEDAHRKENELAKINQTLVETKDKLDKIRKGDWSVIKKLESENKQKPVEKSDEEE